MKAQYRLIIIGGACAGYTAALYAARARLSPLVLTGEEPGGQLLLTGIVENYPGFPDGIDGPELMVNMRKQAEKFGAIMKDIRATSVDFSKRPFTIEANGETFTAEAVIIATGASTKWLGIPGEKEFTGKGVSSCATCDAALFRDREVAVVGGGDAAMEDILALTKFATKITLIHRKDTLRASKIMQERVLSHPKVTPLWNRNVVAVVGDKIISGIKVKNNKSNEVQELALGGLFVAIGHVPNTKFLEGKIDLDEKGYIKPRGMTGTNVEGVFVAGDVADARYRQAVTAAATGCMAAMDAERYLEKR